MLTGGAGADALRGGAGTDTLTAGAGVDDLAGGERSTPSTTPTPRCTP